MAKKPSSKQDIRNNPPKINGKFVKGNKANRLGVGGFGDNPQNRSNGTWDKNTSIGHQYNKLIRMSVDEFKKWQETNPEKERTIAQELAYNAVIKARKNLQYLKEVTDRTEGRATQSTDITSGGEKIIVETRVYGREEN